MKFLNDFLHLLRARLLGTPYFCHFYVTTHCDLKCKQCSFPDDFKRIDTLKKGNMNINEINVLAERLKSIGVHNILLTGGEPFARGDLLDIVHLLIRKNFSVRVVTNGASLVTEERLREIIDAGIDALQVSFDSISPEIHDEIAQQRGTWEKAKRTLEYASAHLKDGMVCALTVVSSMNIHELSDIARYVTSIGAYSIFQPLHLSSAKNEIGMIGMSNYQEMRIRDEKNSIVEETYKKLLQMKKEGYHILSSKRFLRDSIDYFKTSKRRWNCDAYKYYLTICPHGEVLPCLRYEDYEWLEHLNILDENFTKKYKNRAMQENAEAYRKRCLGCVLSCYREMSYLLWSPSVFLETANFIGRKYLRNFSQKFKSLSLCFNKHGFS